VLESPDPNSSNPGSAHRKTQVIPKHNVEFISRVHEEIRGIRIMHSPATRMYLPHMLLEEIVLIAGQQGIATEVATRKGAAQRLKHTGPFVGALL